jgi:microsomal dipeptidase-like Zn-dependent dipeptidase
MAKGLESAASGQNMVESLRKYFTEKEVELICYQNVVNFFVNHL